MSGELARLRSALLTDLVTRATAAYQARDWSAALQLYRHIEDAHPEVAEELSCGLIVARCEIELADDAPPGEPESASDVARYTMHTAAVVHDIKLRAIECCRAGEHRRASRLLRLIAPLDGPIHRCYADGMLSRRSDCADFLHPPADAPPPPFLADQGVSRWPVATLRERYRAMRVLHVRRYAYLNNPARQNEFGDRLTRSGVALGFTVRELNAVALPGPDTERYAGTLQQVIDEFAPQLVFYDELFMSGASAEPGQADDIATILEDARRRRGVRVVKGYTDAWYVAAYTPGDLFKHVGRCVDLVQHCHPAILGHGTDAEKEAVLCYPLPHFMPAPTVDAGTVPRACFVGSATLINLGRLVWWAECARAGLPLDFIEAQVLAAEQISDLEYVNLLRCRQLSVNFTMRPTGARILTGRALEVPLAGGVLIEEDGPDTRYFMTPGVHYVPYETLPDLAEILAALLKDEARRRQLAAAGQAWNAHYFTGDHFWAGLLYRLFG